ncbi:hypothetical protein [Tateyamaria sp. syn59]|uniref:hypothetical protein n=1 Tax=Tateyamaria sp. syn59 TaxID=2576942 RepID=UPI0011BF6270|nr:hypothetical protein [Tateyamaria sp. syn59]
MTRLVFVMTLAGTAFLAACGSAPQDVTRGHSVPFGFMPMTADYDGATSQRAAVDLLSFN